MKPSTFTEDRIQRREEWQRRTAKADAILARGPVAIEQRGDGINRADRRHVAKHRDEKCHRCLTVAKVLSGGAK